MTAFVTVQSYPTRVEAEVDQGFLESQGIKTEIVADDAGGMRPYPLFIKLKS